MHVPCHAQAVTLDLTMVAAALVVGNFQIPDWQTGWQKAANRVLGDIMTT
jgi:hypothetical protein